MTHSSSDISLRSRSTHLAFSLIAVIAVALSAFGLVGALITTDRYVVPEGERITEDQYITSTSGVIDGVVDGNVTIFTGSLRINGTVTGSVTAFASGSVTIAEGGSVGGSLNGAAGSVNILGFVGSDVFIAAGATVVEPSGTVGRDVIGFGGTLRIEGGVDRDVRGRAYRITVDGSVGGDVDVAAQSLGIGGTAVIAGDVLYRSPTEASISSDATVGGTVTRLPTQSNFIYSLILSIANVVSFLGFLVAGIVAIWLFRGTSSRAVGAMLKHPVRSLLVGLGAVIVFPLAVGLLAVTLVGIPLAVVLIAIGVVAFVVGAVPAVTALGNLVLFRRGGLFGAFVVGAIIWRLSFFIPWIGGFLFLLGLVWGIGSWILGAVASRRAEPVPVSLFPSVVSDRTEAAEDWEAPLAPGMVVLDADDEAEVTIDGADEVPLEGPESDASGTEVDAVGIEDENADADAGETDQEEIGDDVPFTAAGEGADDGAVAAATAGGFALDDGADDAPDAEVTEDTDDRQLPPAEAPPAAGERITFDTPQPPTPDDADAADDRDEGGDGDEEEPSLSDRFQALREELLATGTVEPVETSDDDDDRDDDGGWGLPEA